MRGSSYRLLGGNSEPVRRSSAPSAFMRSLAHTNKNRARPADRLTTFAKISLSSDVMRSSCTARSTSSTMNTNCWPWTAFDTARTRNATGVSFEFGWMPNDDSPIAKLCAG